MKHDSPGTREYSWVGPSQTPRRVTAWNSADNSPETGNRRNSPESSLLAGIASTRRNSSCDLGHKTNPRKTPAMFVVWQSVLVEGKGTLACYKQTTQVVSFTHQFLFIPHPFPFSFYQFWVWSGVHGLRCCWRWSSPPSLLLEVEFTVTGMAVFIFWVLSFGFGWNERLILVVCESWLSFSGLKLSFGKRN